VSRSHLHTLISSNSSPITNPTRAPHLDLFLEANPRRAPHPDPFLEPNPRRAPHPDPFLGPNPRRAPHPNPFLEPNPSRAPHPEPIEDLSVRRPNYDERATRYIRLEAPKFGGDLNFEDYLIWKRNMDLYFKKELMSEGSQFKFAKLKLVHQARIYWDKFERMTRLEGEMPINT